MRLVGCRESSPETLMLRLLTSAACASSAVSIASDAGIEQVSSIVALAGFMEKEFLHLLTMSVALAVGSWKGILNIYSP
jgi:hypothetical protein